MEQTKQIKEINKHIREGIRHWADICLTADADNWAYYLEYSQDDVANVCMLFQHVCCNIGIKAGIIGEKEAEIFGNRLHSLIKDMTGIDTHHLFDKKEDSEHE